MQEAFAADQQEPVSVLQASLYRIIAMILQVL
jgi:hypothetical protein